MFRLAMLLLLFPLTCYGQTITIPDAKSTAEGLVIVATGKLVAVSPEFTPADKMLDVSWTVLGNIKAPEFSTIGTGLIVAEPDQGDEVTIVGVALFAPTAPDTKCKLSKSIIIRVKPRQIASGGGNNPPVGSPTTPTTPPAGDIDIPANVTGLHVFLVVASPNGMPADLASLSVGSNPVTQALGQRKSYWYVRNATDSAIAPFAESIKGKQLPLLLVVAKDSQQIRVLDARSISPSGDVNKTARAIITLIARAAGGK